MFFFQNEEQKKRAIFSGIVSWAKNMLIPTVIDKAWWQERAYDIYSRLLEDRIVFMWTAINDEVANTVIAQLLFLEKTNAKKDITMYVNSPWGQVTSTMAMYDTMQLIKPDVSTVCLGLAASWWAITLIWWEKWKRYALPHSEVMIHQPLWWAEGQATDIHITAQHIIKTKDLLNKLVAERTGQKLEKVVIDTERDYYMDAEQALEYWIIDKIIK